MKCFLFTGLLVSSFASYNAALGQGINLVGRVVNGEQVAAKSAEGFPGITLLLAQADNAVAGTITASNGSFKFSNLPTGTYTLALKLIGFPVEKVPVSIVAGQPAHLLIAFPGPCRYNYPKHQLPACVDGHTDGLIPIVYGLPGPETMQRAKAGKIHLGGCQVSGCDPRYYCPVHKREL